MDKLSSFLRSFGHVRNIMKSQQSTGKPAAFSTTGSSKSYYDAAAKEAELRQESSQWDTSNPKPALPGDIPTIDVSNWLETNAPEELQKLGKALKAACEEVGFHQLVGHGLPRSTTDGILNQTRRFHELPNKIKEKIKMDKPDFPLGGVGYLNYGNRKLPKRDTSNQNASFLVKADHTIDLHRDNQWLAEEELPGFQEAVTNYSREMTALAKKLLPIYATALGLEPDYFDPAFERPFFRLRMSHYPTQPQSTASPLFGISPHVDTSFFTLLLTDGSPGLCLFHHPRGEWIQMPPLSEPNALIVNSGELLRQWSNDTFLSVRHFVKPPSSEGKDRYSVPFFFNANSDYKMECLPTCQGPTNPPKYPPFSYNESQGVVQGE